MAQAVLYLEIRHITIHERVGRGAARGYIIGMYQFFEIADVRADTTFRLAEHGARSGAQMQSAAGNVYIPQPEVGTHERQLQSLRIVFALTDVA